MQCGLVISEKLIDQGPEWRAYNNQERARKSHTGSPLTMTYSDKGLSTVIDSRDKDIFGNKIKSRNRAKIYRLRKWNNRSKNHDGISKNLFMAMLELNRLSSQLELPEIIKNAAASLYRKAIFSRKIKGKNIIGMTTAALYITCRMHNIPLTLEDFYKYSNLSNRKIRKNYRYFVESMNIKVPPVDPKIFVPRFCASLNLSTLVQNKVYEILDAIRKKNITSGKGTTKLVAAAIYVAAILEDERRTQKEIAQKLNVSEVTLRKRYKEITKFLKIRLG